jgi:hypothetical protein
MKILAPLCILIWFCSSIYFGTGGYNYIKVKQDEEKAANSSDTIKVVYNEVCYKNKASLLVALEKQATINLYPMIEPLPTSVWVLITIFSFGILGSITNLLKQIALDSKEIVELKFISGPLLGMLTGFIIIGLSYLLPSTLANGDVELKPVSIMFLSLFSGFFSIEFYIFLAKLFNRIFKE